jgi:hypothetical protein
MSRPMKGQVALIVAVLTVLACKTAAAQDDGARSYWKAMAGTNIVGFQYLPFNAVTLDPDAIDPVHYVYPEADVEGNLFFLNYSRHLTLWGRTATLSGFLMGGTLDVEYFGGTPEADLRQSSHGFGDPSVQLSVNLFGAPTLPSFYALASYEPKAVLDIAILGAIPIGDYDENRVVNIGLNRWWGRVALPFTYHIGPYVPGYRTSVEIVPSVSLFAANDGFVGSELKNEPLYQVEAHVTRDFTSHFWGSVDAVYRHGALSTIDDIEAEEPLDGLGVGFTLDFQATDNFGMRFSYHSVVGGDSDIDGDLTRIMGYFGWHALVENIKKLSEG